MKFPFNRHWLFDIGQWAMNYKHWTMAMLDMDTGQWTMYTRQWTE